MQLTNLSSQHGTTSYFRIHRLMSPVCSALTLACLLSQTLTSFHAQKEQNFPAFQSLNTTVGSATKLAQIDRRP